VSRNGRRNGSLQGSPGRRSRRSRSDSAVGGSGNDQLYGDLGGDTLSGNGGIDRIAGGDGADTLNGNEDNDLVLGEAGNDSVLGSSGIDRLDGGSGNDQIDGGGPTFSGGPPLPNTINNVLFGGPGTDTCSYGPIKSLATSTDRGDIRDPSCESPGTAKSQKTFWNGSAYTFSPRSINEAAVFDWNSFDGSELP
jgi:Ca2+-binding RTX toxin-like protein